MENAVGELSSVCWEYGLALWIAFQDFPWKSSLVKLTLCILRLLKLAVFLMQPSNIILHIFQKKRATSNTEVDALEQSRSLTAEQPAVSESCQFKVLHKK